MHSLGSGRGEDGGTAEGATRGGLPWPPLALLMEEKPRSGDREAPRVRPPRAMAQVFSWNHCQRLGSCGGGPPCSRQGGVGRSRGARRGVGALETEQ